MIPSEKDILQFFRDIEFMAPNDRDPREFIDVQNPNNDEPVEDEVGEGIFDNIENRDHSDHPDPQTYSDYYMFNDPARTHGIADSPESPLANKLDKTYHKKNLVDTHSTSDVHHEPLEQGPPAFPRHSGVRSMMEPTVAFNMNVPHEIELKGETYIEGKLYPAGSKVKWEEKVER